METQTVLKSCPQCHSRTTVKNGSVKGIRKWKCKDCRYQFSKDVLSGKSDEVKRLALHMYLEGLGLRSIGRILGVSNVAVLKWVKKAAIEIKRMHLEQSRKRAVTTMELDEMWHYVGKKNENAGYGLLMIESEANLSTSRPVTVITGREENSGTK